ncbi:hypothetical protein EJ06DRAFT_212202 [Trichodelitschia bisporula]|uniref:Uncharacterized protein n=1 Tax=Trichodelitschia bisporula TaxID=703511 RepID=A0A6G1I982_9PEZI|nr:hypothetical protein EJ06DRAFT_212202 [Trichodelitschia bisporula]
MSGFPPTRRQPGPAAFPDTGSSPGVTGAAAAAVAAVASAASVAASAAASAAAGSAAIPPAPPLPPPRPPQGQDNLTARNAFTRFVTQPFSTYGSRPASSQAHRDGGRSSTFAPRNAGTASHSSQDASIKIRSGAEIAALDINHERTHAILAGREILETVQVAGTDVFKDANLREAIIHHDRHNATRHRDTLDIHDVKWSHGPYSSYIATAATNGKVVIYDLNKPGIEVARLHEHHRQVHRVAFSPFQGHLLLSGSQDATVKLWDMRDMTSSRLRFMGQSEGVRDLRWSPRDAVEFAFCTDNGAIQRWDYRNSKSPKLKINAHDKLCTAIDWHPDGQYLMSAGVDKTVKIWDFSSDHRRQKPFAVLRTPFPVHNARWRHPYGLIDGQTARQCTQFATSYERNAATVHVWDFQRPYMPSVEMETMNNGATDMLWRTEDLFWSVGRSGVFQQTDVKFAPRVIDRRPMQALAVSPTGEICVFSQKRPKRRVSDIEYPEGRPDTIFPEKTKLSRSSADDPIDESLLSSSYKPQHGRSQSSRSTKSLSSTPPSYTDPGVRLAEVLTKIKGASASEQVAYRGFLSGPVSALTFSFLAQKYKTAALPDNPTVDSFINFSRVFEQNAQYAQKTGAYRMAQTWRVLGSVVSEELIRKAEEKRRARLNPSRKLPPEGRLEFPKAVPADRRLMSGPPLISRTSSPNGAGIESTSNVPTPLARPQANRSLLPNPDHGDQLALPPSLLGPSRPIKISERVSTGFDGPEWSRSRAGLEERKARMANWRAPPKAPLEFNAPPSNMPPPLDRQNSDESFGMFSSSESQHSASMPASFTSVRSISTHLVPLPEYGDTTSGEVSPNGTIGYRTGTESDFPPSPKNGDSWGAYSLQSSEDPSSTQKSTSEFDMEASGTIMGDQLGDESHEKDAAALAPQRNGVGTPQKAHVGDHTLADFSEITIDGSGRGPISAEALLRKILEYFTNEGPDAQHIMHLILLLKPFLDAHAPEDKEARPMLESYLNYYHTDSNLSVNEAQAVLSNHIRHLARLGVTPWQADGVFATYQDQLRSLQLHIPQTLISRLLYPSFGNFADSTVKDSQIGLLCLSCSKPINNHVNKLKCESCGSRAEPCPICWQKYSPYQVSKRSKKASQVYGSVSATATTTPTSLSSAASSARGAARAPLRVLHPPAPPVLWQFCLVCGHGAHAACLAQQQKGAAAAGPGELLGAQCPTEGCACACVPGPYLEGIVRDVEAEKRRREAGIVQRDGRRVGESRAVGRVGRMLDGDGSGGGSNGGAGGRRVRVVVPDKAGL